MTQVRIFERAMCCSTGVCAANLDPEAPLLQQRAGYELPLIDQVRTALIPWLADEPVGSERLLQLLRA